MVMDNITHLLNNFLHCSAYENVIFCWVMDRQAILDDLLWARGWRDFVSLDFGDPIDYNGTQSALWGKKEM